MTPENQKTSKTLSYWSFLCVNLYTLIILRKDVILKLSKPIPVKVFQTHKKNSMILKQFYHLYPQLLHRIVFLTLELNKPNATPPTTLSVVEIFSTFALLHEGHLADDSLLKNLFS